MLLLATTLSWGEQKASQVFSVGGPRPMGCLPRVPCVLPCSGGSDADGQEGMRRVRQPQPLASFLPPPPDSSSPPSCTAQLVFAECGLGAIVLTVNVILLGGDIVFFQALCLLGYCLFPMCVAAMVCAATANKVGGA